MHIKQRVMTVYTYSVTTRLLAQGSRDPQELSLQTYQVGLLTHRSTMYFLFPDTEHEILHSSELMKTSPCLQRRHRVGLSPSFPAFRYEST